MRAWMMESASPLVANSPGRWVAEAEWPSPRIFERAFRLSRAGLEPAGQEPACRDEVATRTIQSPLSVGLFAGKWCSYAEETDLPWDQRQEDGGALLFDTEPLAEDVEILGAPRVRLRLAADRPVAMVAVRLCDVAPDDRSARVSFGIRNLTHRDSHETPEPLVPGESVDVAFDLNHIAQRFPAGHRIRLAVSSSYWPLAWPPPRPARLTLDLPHSSLVLPIRPADPGDADLRSLGTPKMAEAPPTTLLTPADRRWTVNIDLASNRVEQHVLNNDARVRLDGNGLEIGREALETYTYANNDYGTVRGTVEQLREFRRGDWWVRTVTRTILSSTQSEFLVSATLDAYHGDVRIYSRSWDEAIPRLLV